MITRNSTPDEKCKLFFELFQGRNDVYAKRYESSKSGKTGYAPVCTNEWRYGVCDKPKGHCAKCACAEFKSFSIDTCREHLTGINANGKPFAAAVYPISPDNRTRVAVIEIPEQNWKAKVSAISMAAHGLHIPLSIERAYDGNGCRIWFFFASPVEARIARDLATAVVFAAMRLMPAIGLDTFDRIIPTQDTLPREHFGSILPLPLAPHERKNGYSVFLDNALRPYADQWKFLSSIGRISEINAQRIVRDAYAHHAIILPPSSESFNEFKFLIDANGNSVIRHDILNDTDVSICLDNHVNVDISRLPSEKVFELTGIASFANHEFYNAQRMRIPAKGFPRIISRAVINDNTLSLPRGCLNDVQKILNGATVTINDNRSKGTDIAVNFCGELRPEQKQAMRDLLRHDCGTLAAGTAFGKTVLAAAMIAERKVNTLVLVNRRQLQSQWIARLETFLDLPKKSIGRIGGVGKATGIIDIATVQSMIRKGKIRGDLVDYGQVIVDECHAVSAPTFETVTDTMHSRYFLGLSATVARRDGHHPLIAMQCGPVRHRADGKLTTRNEPFAHVVEVRPTSFTPSAEARSGNGRSDFCTTQNEMIGNTARNNLIAADALDAIAQGRSPLILTDRRAHVEIFRDMLADKVENIIVLVGGASKRELKAIRQQLDSLPDFAPRLLIATGAYIGEGFDDTRLDTLLLAMPVSWRGRITQYVGRLHRRHLGKREVRVYDYVDIEIPMCNRMFDRRSAGYDALGYTIRLPLSSTPGWPKGSAIPLERQWQETYSASVKRLCADGVDAALASLFIVATKAVTDNDTGTDRARSAGEAFLFKRLDSLKETAGKFMLNAKIPVEFGETPFIEADLLCEEKRLVIEIDGSQHLGNVESYRRDRYKDFILQENGYFVMRFLYEDVLSKLDTILNSVLRIFNNMTSRKEM